MDMVMFMKGVDKNIEQLNDKVERLIKTGREFCGRGYTYKDSDQAKWMIDHIQHSIDYYNQK